MKIYLYSFFAAWYTSQQTEVFYYKYLSIISEMGMKYLHNPESTNCEPLYNNIDYKCTGRLNSSGEH